MHHIIFTHLGGKKINKNGVLSINPNESKLFKRNKFVEYD
jgi:hypothetical protein